MRTSAESSPLLQNEERTHYSSTRSHVYEWMERQETEEEEEVVIVPQSWFRRNKCMVIIITLLCWAFIAIVLVLNFLVIGPKLPPPGDDREIRFLSLSVWGYGQDKEERMKAIGAFIANSTEYDVVVLQDLLMRPDHETIRAMLPPGDHMKTGPLTIQLLDRVMTAVGALAPALCDGRILPTSCSGLALISRFPLLEIELTVFSVHGDLWWQDGEYWARKGTGRVRIRPARNTTVDIFLTATAAYDYNHYYRQIQAKELAATVAKSDADYVLAATALNSDPRNSEDTYHSVASSGLTNAAEAFLGSKWTAQRFCTYGNKGNSYSRLDSPLIYDYLWYKAAWRREIKVKQFSVPLLNMANGKSLSNHEAVAASFVLK